MTEPALKETLLSAFSRLSAEDQSSLDELRAIYADDVVFQDPIQKVHGLEEFLGLNRRLARRSRELSFVIERVVDGEEELCVTWHMRLRLKIGPPFELDGISHIRVEGGKVRYHRDYWDLAELFASAIPGGQRMLRVLLRPLA